MLKLLSILLLSAICVGVFAHTDNECDFDEETCGIEYISDFINIQLLFPYSQNDRECQLALSTIDCYIGLTNKCDVQEKAKDLQRLANLRVFVQYLCYPAEFNDTMPDSLQCIQNFSHCLVDMPFYVRHKELLPDGDNLDQNCPIIVKTVECVNEQIRNCISPQQDIFQTNLINRFFSSLCNKDSTMNKLYRENVMCVSKHRGQLSKTMVATLDFLRKFADYLTDQGLAYDAVSRAAICTVSDMVTSKIPEVIKEECNEDAGRFASDLMTTFLKICPAKYFEGELEQLTGHLMNFVIIYASGEDDNNSGDSENLE